MNDWLLFAADNLALLEDVNAQSVPTPSLSDGDPLTCAFITEAVLEFDNPVWVREVRITASSQGEAQIHDNTSAYTVSSLFLNHYGHTAIRKD